MTSPSKGFVPTAAAFAIWGLFPLYFQPLHQVSSLQVVAHRVVWACLFVLVWIAVRGELPTVRAALADRAILWRLTVTAMLISLNWLVYVWGVLHGHVLETSLGYFIGPLVNVVLGVVLLSERLTPAQWTAVALAAIGVGYLTVMAGGLPWIALTLAFLFAIYGLIRKVVKVESLPGLAIETVALVPFAAGYLLWCESAGTGALGHAGFVIDARLIGSGPLTAFALFLFAYGARLLPYSTVGLLQYITPTLQFACGVFAFHEPFERTRAIGFMVIWAALLIYAGEGLRLSRRQQRVLNMVA
ncbi:MAG TPA: EamA family transporter RarD [Steroidobacteraceae bacterium]|nr:EamA family transporter RarD [Steroidobacteraceae bacterium]